MLRYYLGADEYTRHGPPPLLLRALVAPVLIVSTVVLFATGTALLVLDQTEGTLVGLHKASFIVWLVVTGLHVLVYAPRLPRLLRGDFRPRQRIGGAQLRRGALAAALVAGATLAAATFPLAGPWLHAH
jgi:hypothetical protein